MKHASTNVAMMKDEIPFTCSYVSMEEHLASCESHLQEKTETLKLISKQVCVAVNVRQNGSTRVSNNRSINFCKNAFLVIEHRMSYHNKLK